MANRALSINSPMHSTNLSTNKAAGANSAQQSFGDVLKNELEKANSGSVEFSKHALARAEERGITVNNSLLDRLTDGVKRAGEKGATNVLALDGGRAFIVNVPNNRVITTISEGEMKQNIFTNIDSAVIL